MRTLGIGVIGLGVGLKHARAFAGHPACEVRALCDLDPAALAKGLEACPGARGMDDAMQLIAAPDVDVVSVASFDDAHFPQVRAALEAGKHVFAEKPLCLHRAEAEELHEMLAANPGLRLSSNLNLRTCPRFARARDAARSGEMGAVYHLEGDYLWGRPWKLTEGWRGRMAHYSVILGAAVHMIDLALWIKGSVPATVQAMGNSLATAGTGFPFDDFAVALLRFADGSTAKVTAHGGCAHPHFHRLAIYGTRRTFLHESAGAVAFHAEAGECARSEPPGGYPGIEEKSRLIHDFVGAVLDPSRPMLVPARDVFDVMAVCFAAQEATRSNRAEPVTLFSP